MFDANGESSPSDQQLAQSAGLAFTLGDAFHVANDMRPAQLALIWGMIIITPVPITDENTLELAQQFSGSAFASGIMGQKIDREGRTQCP